MHKKSNQINQVTINQKDSLSVAAYSAFVFSLISIIYKVINNPNASSYYFEVSIILIMTFSIFAHRIITKVYNLPVKLSGKRALNFSNSELKSRMIHYFKDSIIFSAFYFFAVHIILKKQYIFSIFIDNVNIQIFFELLFTILVAFLTDLVWYEANIRMYNKSKKN